MRISRPPSQFKSYSSSDSSKSHLGRCYSIPKPDGRTCDLDDLFIIGCATNWKLRRIYQDCAGGEGVGVGEWGKQGRLGSLYN